MTTIAHTRTSDGWCVTINPEDTAYAITRTPLGEHYRATDDDIYIVTRESAVDVATSVLERHSIAQVYHSVMKMITLSGAVGIALLMLFPTNPMVPMMWLTLISAAVTFCLIVYGTRHTGLRAGCDRRLHAHLSDSTRVSTSRLIGPTAMTVPLAGHEEVFLHLDDRRAGDMLSRFDTDTPFR